MVIFHCYVSSPEGMSKLYPSNWLNVSGHKGVFVAPFFEVLGGSRYVQDLGWTWNRQNSTQNPTTNWPCPVAKMQFVWFPCLVWKCVEWLAEMTWCDLQDSLLFSELQIYTDAESHQTQLGSHFWWPKSPPQSCSQDSCWLFWLWPAGRSNRLLPSTKLFDVDWLDWGKPIKTNHSIFWRFNSNNWCG